MVNHYPGLFNSSYHPSPIELLFIQTPVDQLGPPLLGQIVLTLLQGVLFAQYYEYLLHFWEEKRWTKWLVHAAAALCAIKLIYIWWFTWDRFVNHYGDWLYLSIFTPISVAIGISSTIPSAVAQTFYIHRCWMLSHNWFFVVPAILSLIVTVGSGIVLTWGSVMAAGGILRGFRIITIAANTTLASGLICDLFITIFTCYYLVKNKTGFAQTDNLVFRLVKCSIESAAGPTIVALINLILTNRSTNNQWFLFPNIILSHVYGCSLLYTVNARRNVAGTLTTVVTGSLGSCPRSPTKTGRENGTAGAATKRSLGIWRPRSLRTLTSTERHPQSMHGVLVEVQTILHEDQLPTLARTKAGDSNS
ncbi:hypothetical protein M422DRAFT_261318 [Sphaerobolus stellatus SS14]|uniref:DUF6534 domain-containing protein n=1 Tax=Sphaerobolus stellatus (strain SS14) TaxID=990650 RepID=A0A0C9UND8_SPHS4|nr:hypothetical protein M422DRAFT_261318 [Sphaerobolus stellatus SS14]